MDAKHGATAGTGPPCRLQSQEGIDPPVSDYQQIFDKTGAILLAVAQVKLLYPPAGEFLTFKTKPGCCVVEVFATRDDTLPDAHLFVVRMNATARTMVFHPQVGHASAAIHPAGSNLMPFKPYGTIHIGLHVDVNGYRSQQKKY